MRGNKSCFSLDFAVVDVNVGGCWWLVPTYYPAAPIPCGVEGKGIVPPTLLAPNAAPLAVVREIAYMPVTIMVTVFSREYMPPTDPTYYPPTLHQSPGSSSRRFNGQGR